MAWASVGGVKIGDFQGAAHQGREGFRIAAGLQKTVVAVGLHVVPAQRLNGEIMRVAADAADADPFALQILRLFDIAAGDQGLGHDIFHPADENHIGGALHIGRDIADAAGHGHLGIAAEQRRGDDAR